MQVQNSTSEQTQTEQSPVEVLQTWLVNQLAEVLSKKPDEIDVSESLTRYGLDSIDAVTLVGDLEDWLDLDDVELPSTLFWDHPTIENAAQYLVSEFDISDLDSSEGEEAKAAPAEKTKKSGWGGFFKGK
ncbi:acyl carrier protein [Roseofilum reptotaenium CS-1145]|uniref:Carrier domain-containing protein n=1 Tax=Roseofilum reptotaenium AO1-A TaxID=1925591 RepID=A0A1L9QY30_9CYAN|nr:MULTISPECIES: acyl carrier protein [Roseofilum]MBP0028544.1 acyl carrier protein [Roseofilum sp. Guam]MDB9519985.1 acyl carrier protein [Roseofilum reptotaenium CS-1145]OJJ27598.1 hypothetical protein BI308_01125 [Roseofilum reptotaenium AO1-A]